MQHTFNVFLASLAPADIASLRPHLKTVELPQGEVLFDVGATIHQVYFPHSGIVSLVVELASGETIESAMIGRESLVGASSGLNGQVSVCKAIVQIAGAASALASKRLRAGSREAEISLPRRRPRLFGTRHGVTKFLPCRTPSLSAVSE